MREQFYIVKSFTKDAIHKAEEDDPDFLGYIVLDIATTHKDRQNDVLTKNFIANTVKDLRENNTFFLNHDTGKNPIGLVTEATLAQLEAKSILEKLDDTDDFHYAARLKVGISKTAKDVWTLVEEGIYNKGSIGGMMWDWEWNEEGEFFVVDKGETLEGSLVGVPAQKKATMVDVLQKMRKSYLKGDDMDEDKIMASVSKMFEDKMKSFNEETEKATKHKEELEKALVDKGSEFEEEIKKYEEQLAALEEEKKALEKDAKGRQTQGDGDTPPRDKYYLDDPKKALKKGLFEFGKMLKQDEAFIAMLIGSNDADEFEDGDFE